MTQQEINEYNERCLQILGRKLSEIEIKYIDEHTHLQEYRDAEITDLQFHSDWNWIMEVVEVIEKLKYEVHIFAHYNWKEPNRCVIQDWKINEIAQISSDSKKEAVVRAINQFLIWYEENNG